MGAYVHVTHCSPSIDRLHAIMSNFQSRSNKLYSAVLLTENELT
jgi:hypothetical protein